MVFMFDYLDIIMWSIASSGILLGIMMLTLPYKASSDTIEETGKSTSRGLAIGIGLNGLFLFVAGFNILANWLLNIKGTGFEAFVPGLDKGVYNVLYGGPITFGGLVLLGVSAALFSNRGLKAISYFGIVEGLYLVVCAYADWFYPLIAPDRIVPLFLSVAASTFLSVPATHSDNKWMRRIFAVLAFLYAAVWIYTAANTTISHLNPKGASN